MKQVPKTMQANIIDLVCEFYGINYTELDDKKPNQFSSYRRHICWYLLRKNTTMSYACIAKEFNTRYSTIQNGLDNIDNLLSYDRLTKGTVKDLQNIIDNFNILKIENLLQKEWPTLPVNITPLLKR